MSWFIEMWTQKEKQMENEKRADVQCCSLRKRFDYPMLGSHMWWRHGCLYERKALFLWLKPTRDFFFFNKYGKQKHTMKNAKVQQYRHTKHQVHKGSHTYTSTHYTAASRSVCCCDIGNSARCLSIKLWNRPEGRDTTLLSQVPDLY